MRNSTPTEKAFSHTRAMARRRGEDWQLTLAEWRSLWEHGSYLHRGKQPGQYAIVRDDPTEPWTVANCRMHQHGSKRGYGVDLLDEHGLPKRTNVRTLTVHQWVEELRRG